MCKQQKFNLNEVMPEKKELPKPPMDEKPPKKDYPTPKEADKKQNSKPE